MQETQRRTTLTPTVFEKGRHPLNKEDIDVDALFVLNRLNKAGFSSYLVGGGVRDIYLGKVPKDFDISTNARPGQVRHLFPRSAIIGRRFRLVEVFFRGGKIIQVSTLRSLSEHDIDSPDSVLAPNNTFGTLEEDAQRRDLTINSLFYDVRDETVIDYVGGVEDLKNRLIRLVGDPERRLHTDPVRALRAIRHAARSGFTIEEKTWQAILKHRQELSLCPPTRIRDEILKDLRGGQAAGWLELCLQAEVFAVIFPLYRDIEINAPITDQLIALLRLLDRLCRSGKTPKTESFLFALPVIPYAEIKYRFFSEKRPSAALYQIGKALRADLDRELAQPLNMARVVRQEMAALLTQTANLLHQRTVRGWPKWLREKSYFAEAAFLCKLYLEAMGEEMAEETMKWPEIPEALATPVEKPEPAKAIRPLAAPESGKENRLPRPASASDRPGGIFGLRK
ncbi:MAG: polynucleotide adenylyltransferase PcnB [Desulfobulbaceae bacterium]|jgi:poly(A) polymerase|nr:polynucleotide adenylyltransferase PcnB [Desulfobulbaceae bacterium]